MSDRIVSYLRTAVPAAWGWLLAAFAAQIPGPLAEALATPEVKSAVTVGAVVAWYALWRWAEPRLPDWLTRLVLGSAQAPAYAPPGADGVADATSLTPDERSVIRDMRLLEGRNPQSGATDG